MKKHHATILVIIGLVAVVLAVSLTFDSEPREREGYTVGTSGDEDAIACCSIGEKTCYAFESCDVCEAVCG